MAIAHGRDRAARTSRGAGRFDGFTGHFQGKRRDVIATGTVTVDGVTLVNGSTTNAELETLEDTNVRR